MTAATKTSGLIVACAVIGILLGVVGLTISCINYGTNLAPAVRCSTPAPGTAGGNPSDPSRDLISPLKKTMLLWFAWGYLCSVLLLAGGIGLLIRHKWGWWVSLAGYPVGGAALVVIIILTRRLSLVLGLDLGITLVMIGWLLAIRRRFFALGHG